MAHRTLIPCGAPLTPEGKWYARDLALSRVDGERTVATWVEDRRTEAFIAFRVIVSDGGLGTCRRVKPHRAFPSTPRFLAPDRIVWVEWDQATGRLVWARVDVGNGEAGQAEPVPGLEMCNVGDYACARTADGTVWFLVEARAPGSQLVIASAGPESALHVREVLKHAEFGRPCLATGRGALVGAWEEYRPGSGSEIVVRSWAGVREREEKLFRPDGWNEQFCTLAQGGDGTWFAARCRERLVELDGGVAQYHSELAVAAQDSNGWSDVGTVDIDHGLNPWMAGYTGARRFPFLAAGRDSAILSWEEKEDAATMDPAPARFCAAEFGRSGMRGVPWMAVQNVSYLVAETGAGADSTWLASKTQTCHNEQHLVWRLHRLAGPAGCAPRPGGLASNRSAAPFHVRPLKGNRPAMTDAGYRLYFGDIHLHSRLSGDLDGEQDELYRFARDTARLDFAAFTENDAHRLIEPMTPAIREQDARLAAAFNDPGRFTTLLGWEYTKHAEPELRDPVPNSHRCVIFEGDSVEVHPYWDEGVRTPAPAHLCAQFRGRRVLLHHHHGTGFDITDDTLERNIEIASGWAVCMLDAKFQQAVHGLLARGFRLGFFGASDNHERNPGLGGALTGVWAHDNTREAIFDALWNRRIFATTGLRPDLRFTVNGEPMGGAVTVPGIPEIRCSVEESVPVEFVEVIRDGQVVHRLEVSATRVEFEWRDESAAPGRHDYYAHVSFRGREHNPYWNVANAYGIHAWTSPVRVVRDG